MDLTQIKGFYLIFLTVFIYACKSESYELHVFIPEDYEGSITIGYNIKNSKNRVIKTGNTYIIFLTGNPMFFDFKDPMPESGYYTIYAYYYSKNSLKNIRVDGIGFQDDKLFPMLNAEGTNGSDIEYFTIYKDSLSFIKKDSLKEISSKLFIEKNIDSLWQN